MRYEDIYLQPRICTVISRGQCDVRTTFLGKTWRLPVVPSNMPAIINVPLALELAKGGYFYVLHRFMPYDQIINFVSQCKACKVPVSISIGINQKDLNLLETLQRFGFEPDYITIDVAHGHSSNVYHALGYGKWLYPNSKFIVGNVGTVDGVLDLQKWGADAVKIGIGVSDVCTTYPNTGFYCHPVDLLLALQQSPELSVEIVADGGIRTHGDIAKALTLGADMAMAGGIFAGHEESPGETIFIDDKPYKWYFGNASSMRGNTKNIEGTELRVPLKGSIFQTLAEIEQNLQSAISYAGGANIAAFKNVDIGYIDR